MAGISGPVSGIAAGAFVATIADATNPSNVLKIDKSGAAAVEPQALSPSGAELAIRSDESGRQVTSHAELLKRMAIEMRAATNILAFLANHPDDPDVIRNDAQIELEALAEEANI